MSEKERCKKKVSIVRREESDGTGSLELGGLIMKKGSCEQVCITSDGYIKRETLNKIVADIEWKV